MDNMDMPIHIISKARFFVFALNFAKFESDFFSKHLQSLCSNPFNCQLEDFLWNVKISWRVISCNIPETFITAGEFVNKNETEMKTICMLHIFYNFVCHRAQKETF